MYLVVSFFLFLVSFVLFLLGVNFNLNDFVLFMDWDFFSINSCSFAMTLVFDWMSLVFMSFVLFISSMIIIYSYSYMSADITLFRFLFLVVMFIISMMFMIVSPSLVSILLGWDGLGLVSYCLVVYFQNISSNNAGMLTILVNRVGDAAVLVSISWMFNFGSWHYILYAGIWDFNMMMVAFMLIVAGFTKSAQIPFSSWLPAAMAAPTPVSALVHSSTLVTAGVYLLIRFEYMFINMNCYFFIFLSSFTMLLSGFSAFFEFDLKKIIAFSTLSQLGLMMSALFMGFSMLSFFHLLTHAFFSALMFLCAGLMIHVMGGNQDLRMMGGLFNSIPWTYSCFFISNISLCGIPFMSGFYSKDMILEMTYGVNHNLMILIFFYLSISLTLLYSFRLIYYSLSPSNVYCCQSYFEGYFMVFPMFFMALMSILSGSAMMWMIFRVPSIVMLGSNMKLLPLFMLFMVFVLSYNLYLYNFYFSFKFLNFVICSMVFMHSFNISVLSKMGFSVSSTFYRNVDSGWGEYLVSKSFFLFILTLSSKSVKFYTNGMKLLLISFVLSSFFFFI